MQSNPLVPANPAPFQFPLTNVAKALAADRPVKIIAVGSSSVAGERASDIVPFPYLFQMLLRKHFEGKKMIDIINRGRGGEDALQQVERLQSEVVDQKPDMVIWQMGTNAVWKDEKLNEIPGAIARGLRLMSGKDMDIVLMDPQYAPAILTDNRKEAAFQMVKSIGELAAQAEANVFQRFDLMRRWHELEGISFDNMINPGDHDRLHQNDASTFRIDWDLRQVILMKLGT